MIFKMSPLYDIHIGRVSLNIDILKVSASFMCGYYDNTMTCEFTSIKKLSVFCTKV